MATTFVQLKMCKVDLRNYIDEKLRNNLEVDLIVLNSYRKVIEQIKSAENRLLVKNTETKSAFHHPPPEPSAISIRLGAYFLWWKEFHKEISRINRKIAILQSNIQKRNEHIQIKLNALLLIKEAQDAKTKAENEC